MKKKLIKGVLTLMAIILSYVIIDSMFFPTSISYSEKYENEMISFKDNVVTIDYYMMNLFLEEINGFIDYGNNLKTIYNNIITKYQKDKNINMYESGKNMVIEVKYKNKEAKELFGDIITTDKDVKVKVLFNKNWNQKNVNLESLNYKLNGELVLRNRVVSVAQKQVGQYGKKYWNWWGLNRRMEWCCVFVSYVAYESGVMETHIPRFAGVTAGMRYFKSKGQFKYAGKYTPKPGDVVFFNFPSDHLVDHVGIVVKVDKNKIYTVEGNANSDYVRKKEYPLNSPYLYAYGTPDYKKIK